MSALPGDLVLTATDLGKTYGSTAALQDVWLELRVGEIHALVGENGAGKSTLGRILCGLVRPDSGTMQLDARPYAPVSKTDAERQGVRIVLQELNLIGTLTIAENIFLRTMPRNGGVIDYSRLHTDARRVMALVGLEDLSPTCLVQTLGVGQQQMVEIAAALAEQCRVLILDEPTAALTEIEANRLFEYLERLRESGTAIVYVSHRMEEITRLADRITVLRDGRLVATRRADELTLDEIIRLMVGRDLGKDVWRSKPHGDLALRVHGLRRGNAVQGVSLELYQGEILGIAGLMGSGRTETVRAIFGADRPEAGEIFLKGSDKPAVIREPSDAIRQGIALLTEDRKGQGLLLSRPIRENLTLMRLRGLSRRGGWISTAREAAAANRLVQSLHVRCRSIEQLAGELSGGNQQKVVIAKWIDRDCDIFLFDEPTRGIDIGARFEIYALLNSLAEQGKAILVVSSDLLELMALCDRIAVMSAGRIADTFARGEWTADKIMAAALGGDGPSKKSRNPPPAPLQGGRE